MLLHCLYLHIFPEKEVKPDLWNLACDIAVELVMEGEQIAELALPEDLARNRFIYSFGGKKCSAQQIYQMLEKKEFHESNDITDSCNSAESRYIIVVFLLHFHPLQFPLFFLITIAGIFQLHQIHQCL